MSRNRILFSILTLLLAAACAQDGGKKAAQAPEEAAAKAAFCEEHQIAEAQCPFCNPELVDTLGFCNGHGVPEAFCYQCNPALIPAFQAVGDWCAGHDRPESQCYICNPELDPSRQEQGALLEGPGESSIGALEPAGDLPRSRMPPAVHCSTQDLVVQFESADIPRHAGLEVVAAERRPITKTIECNARLAYDGDRHARLSPQVAGIVARIHADLGDEVRAGDPLVTITSAALGAAKAAYLEARATLELWTRHHARESDLLARGAGTERDLLEAETRLSESRIALSRAEQELLLLGLSRERIEKLSENLDTSPSYVLAAPFDGTVVERCAALGEITDPARPLFAVADVSRIWALLDVSESDIPEVRVGQPVVLSVDGLRGQALPGVITWVAAHVDPRTRTLPARAELENPGKALKANMFARAQVAVRDRHSAVVVPAGAVQWEGCCNVVFVKRSDVLYEPRKVLLGVDTGTAYEVLQGLAAGEEIVTQGSFLLKTEILKGSIGAGCCEVEPGA
jgi:cobalt-zinc-cadmium efflux system membrane fusion protein